MFIYVLLIATLSVNKVSALSGCTSFADFSLGCPNINPFFVAFPSMPSNIDAYCSDALPTSSCITTAEGCAANDANYDLYVKTAKFKNYVCVGGRSVVTSYQNCLTAIFADTTLQCETQAVPCDMETCYFTITTAFCNSGLLMCNYFTIVKGYTCDIPNCPAPPKAEVTTDGTTIAPTTAGTTNKLTTEVTTISTDGTTRASSSNTVDFTSLTTNVEVITLTKTEDLTSSNTIYGSSSFAKTSDPTLTYSTSDVIISSKAADLISSNTNAGVTSSDATTTKVPAVSTALGIGLVVGCAVSIGLLSCFVLFVSKGRIKKKKAFEIVNKSLNK